MLKKHSEPMWCVVMFDLPVGTKKQRSEANRVRNHLFDLDFCRAQFSVYVQYLPLGVRLHILAKSIKTELPHGGDVRILAVTDTQWSKTIRYSNTSEAKPEETPSQLVIF